MSPQTQTLFVLTEGPDSSQFPQQISILSCKKPSLYPWSYLSRRSKYFTCSSCKVLKKKKNIFKEYDVTLETDIDTKCFFFTYITRSCCWLISKTQRHTSEGAKCMCSHFYLKLNETESFCLLALVAVH